MTERREIHGTRARYQASCRCTPCRAANAAYEAQRAKDHTAGKVRLGTIISPAEAFTRLRQLKAEHIHGITLARALGLKNDSPRLYTSGITVRKLLKIRRIYRLAMLDSQE